MTTRANNFYYCPGGRSPGQISEITALFAISKNRKNISFYINDQKTDDSSEFLKDGLNFTMKKEDIEFYGKFYKVKAIIQISDNAPSTKWKVSMSNAGDGMFCNSIVQIIFSLYTNQFFCIVAVNKDIDVLHVMNAKLGEWTAWSSCSISCAVEGSGDFGTRTRSADCIEGINGGKTCSNLLGEDALVKTVEENCAGIIDYCPVNHRFLPWSPWSECYEPSNPIITQTRSRSCLDGQYGGSACPQNVRFVEFFAMYFNHL